VSTERDHQAIHYASWAARVPKPDTVSGDIAGRAAFFTAIERHGVPEGLQNIYLPEALTLAPYHPYTAADVPGRLAAIPQGEIEAAKSLVKGGLDVLHVPLLRSYGACVLDAYDLSLPAGQDDVPLDPVYGYFFDRELNPVPLALSYWAKRLQARRDGDVGFQRLSNVADTPASVLTTGIEEGAFIGAGLFEMMNVRVSAPGAVPEIPVSNEHDFNVIVGALGMAAAQLGRCRLWFRGQTKEYPILPIAGLRDGPRARRRPSLVPQVYRKLPEHTDDLDKYRALVLRFGEWSYWASTHLPLTTEPTSANPPQTGFGLTFESSRTYYDEHGKEIQRETKEFPAGVTELRHGLILQHYGAPTGYLDITSDPEIGLWFALNALENGRYRPHEWSGDDPATWPVVYVMALVEDVHPFIDSAALWKDTDAVRPQRQRCGLLGGSGNLFRNFPACFVSVVLRLRPGFVVARPRATSEIFPGPDEDPFLTRLLAEDKTIAATGRAQPLFPVTTYN
jgi:hypothetical protein